MPWNEKLIYDRRLSCWDEAADGSTPLAAIVDKGCVTRDGNRETSLMTLSRGWVAIGMTYTLLFSAIGCDDPQAAMQVSRLQEQLTQADSRVEVATQQLIAAQDQIESQKASLVEAEERLTAERRRWEGERRAAADSLRHLQEELAEARGVIAEHNRKMIEAEAVRSVLGEWTIFGAEHKYRFAFLDNGDVKAQQYVSGQYDASGHSYWIRLPEGTAIDIPAFRPNTSIKSTLPRQLMFRRASGSRFVLYSKTSGGAVTEEGEFVVEDNGKGKIRTRHLPLGKYDEPTWYKASQEKDQQ